MVHPFKVMSGNMIQSRLVIWEPYISLIALLTLRLRQRRSLRRIDLQLHSLLLLHPLFHAMNLLSTDSFVPDVTWLKALRINNRAVKDSA